ncbi:MAG: diadenosine tetraphosphate hydrolase, partial [Pseudomonadota bacterium]
PEVQKLNVGALGNRVRQLHVHIVGRHAGDPAWPDPVWGFGSAEPYGPGQAEPLCEALRRAFAETRL